MITYSPNVVVEKMPNTEKYTLSGTKNNKYDHFWIGVRNPSDEEMDFVIGYMVTGPKPSKYPIIRAVRENGDTFTLEPDPSAADAWGNMKVHVTRMAFLGSIKPHTDLAKTYFFPMEESEYPFRIVQVMLIPTKYQLSQIYSQ